MRAPLSWLREYVTVDATAEEIARPALHSARPGRRVIDVGVPDVDGNLGRFLVGRVLEVGAHPNADRLRVCQVDVGEGDARQIVCGAWNFEAGATVAVALPGAFLPIFDQPLDERELRGQPSRGMILAEDEVGLGDDHAGIMVLPSGLEPGTPLVDVLPIRDQVLDVTPTVNRVDLLSMVGLAREVAALLGGELHPPGADDPEVVDARGGRRHDRGLRRLPALHRPRLPRRRDRPVAAVAALAPLPRRDALDLERRRRHELRHARLGQPAPRLRPREARRRAHRRPARARPARSCARSTGRSAGSIPKTSLITDGERAVALAAIMGGEDSEVTDDDDRGAARGGELRAARDPRARRSGSRSARRARTAGRRASTRTSPRTPRCSRAACSSISRARG